MFGLSTNELLEKIGLMAFDGDWKQFFIYVFNEFYSNSSIRDSIYREEGIKGFVLAYLGMSGAYRVRSEAELNKGYVDIYLTPKTNIYTDMLPDNYLIELKYVKKSDLRSNNRQKLIDKHLEQAKTQLEKYASDNQIPKNTKKIVAITTSDELLLLKEV